MNYHLNSISKHKPNGKKVFWEVYSGISNLSQAMEARGWTVRTFDLPMGLYQGRVHPRLPPISG